MCRHGPQMFKGVAYDIEKSTYTHKYIYTELPHQSKNLRFTPRRVSELFEHWNGSEILPSQLQSLQSPSAQPSPSKCCDIQQAKPRNLMFRNKPCQVRTFIQKKACLLRSSNLSVPMDCHVAPLGNSCKRNSASEGVYLESLLAWVSK